MNNLAALYFPETSSGEETTRKLLLFFKELCFYRTAESPLQAEEQGIFFKKRLCISRTPIPLGDDLPRFQQLLRDLKGHENEYYSGYLSSLSMGLSQDRDEASVWTLVSRMAKGDKKDEADISQKEVVWRAMLLLKLAEMLTQEEREISQGLISIASQKAQLLKNLKGDDNESEEIDLSMFDTRPPSRPPINMEQLTKAWGQLYVRDKDEQLPSILVTAEQEATGLVLDTYEELFKKNPLLLCSLPVPGLRTFSDADYLEKRKAFQESAQEQLTNFSEIFSLISSHKVSEPVTEETLEVLKKNSISWSANLADHFEKTAASHSLNIFLLKGCSFLGLFQKICRTENTNIYTTPLLSHGILATLTPES